MQRKSVIVGTAGHIDHGKTSLVKALTGIDADRLEEEKRRGITIDIGFAHMELFGGKSAPDVRIGFVDVPGHERFVRNMLAGTGGIDMVLLVIAADEGVMPQTREHFEICRLLGVKHGITVLTKSDAVDEATLAETRAEAAELVRGSFLDAAPMVAVSSTTGAGLETLKAALARVAGAIETRDALAMLRLPIDRVFVMKGFGTVVTGTLVSGSVKKDDEVELLPAGKRVRVRSVQVHGQATGKAVAGERTALNLVGVANEEMARGMTLTEPGALQTTYRLDTRVTMLKSAPPLKDRAKVHLHLHTCETVAQVKLLEDGPLQPGGPGLVQLRTRQPLVALPGDRFIIRQFSPVVTIGGGVVLDNAPMERQKPEEAVRFLAAQIKGMGKGKGKGKSEKLLARIARRLEQGLETKRMVAETGLRQEKIERTLAEDVRGGKVLRFGETWIAIEHFQYALQELQEEVREFHDANPLVAGMSKQELRERVKLPVDVFAAALEAAIKGGKLEAGGEQVTEAGRKVVMKDEESDAKAAIEMAFSSAGLKVPALKEVLAGLPLEKTRAQKLVTLLLRDRVLIKLTDDLVFHQSALESLRQRVREYKTKSQKIDVAAFKELSGVSRKYAIPLLEMLDRERITRREGDTRVIL